MFLCCRQPGGLAVVAPLFLLYDYSFLRAGKATKNEGLAYAHESGSSRQNTGWPRRLTACPSSPVNHYPLDRHPREVPRYPRIAMWCGTTVTAEWHRRFRVDTMVYGRLRIPRTAWHEGVRFEEVSVGYPREQSKRPGPPGTLRCILPVEVSAR